MRDYIIMADAACELAEAFSEEYEIKIAAVDTLKETLAKYHGKEKKVAPAKK